MKERPLGTKAYNSRPQMCHRDCYDSYESKHSRTWRKKSKRAMRRQEKREWRKDQAS